MANYKVIFRADRTGNAKAVSWEPGCPVIIDAVQVSRDTDTGEAFLQVKVENATDHTIEEIAARAIIAFSSGESQTIAIRELDADVAGGASHTFKPTKLESGDVQDVSVAIVSATSGESRWDSMQEPTAIPKAKPLQLSDKALGERKVRLGQPGNNPNVLGSAPVRGEGWWVCGCGGINVGTGVCRRCGADLPTLLSLEDERQLEQWADERESARVQKAYVEAKTLQDKGDAASLEKAITLFDSIADYEDSCERAGICRDALSETQQAQSSRKKKLAIAFAAIAVGAIAAFLVATTIIIPNAKTAEAIALIESGSFTEALDILKELDSTGKSTESIVDAYLDSAEQYAGSGDYETAFDLVQSMSPYIDTEDLLRSYATHAGDAYMAEDAYLAAVSWYEKAGDAERVQDAEYHYVKAHFFNEDPTTFDFLKKLRDAGYLDSESLYEQLYAWDVDLADIYNPDRTGLRLVFAMAGGEPGGELPFHVVFTRTVVRNDTAKDYTSSYDFVLSMEDFESLQQMHDHGDGYASIEIKNRNDTHFNYTTYITAGSSSESITVTVTANGEEYSETVVLK